jgi:enoyl-CoA hydratase
VVILGAEGKHFSAGHDLKELLAGEEHWAAMRDTPEGKLVHEQTMYFDKLVRIRDFRKVTIAAVQGTCSAAGLMLACMCDLIVAADDAVFSNPVLRMTGAGVELLVEPWELGVRKAKEFLWTGDALDAREAWRLGLVNRVVPRARLARETLALAERIALVPPVTASLVKESLNQTAALMGKEHAWRYHFMVHQFMHGTKTASDALKARKKSGSMKRMLAERDRPFAPASRRSR